MIPSSRTPSLCLAAAAGLLLQLATAASIHAQVDVYPGDARSAGMGAAFTAVAEGAAAAWWNPAALAFGPGISVAPISYMDLTPGGNAVAPGIVRSTDSDTKHSLWTSAGAARFGPVGAGLVYQELDRRSSFPWIAGRSSSHSTLRTLRLGGGIDFLGSLLPEETRFRCGLGGNVKWFDEEEDFPWNPAAARSSTYDADVGVVFSYRERDSTPRTSSGSPPEEVAVRAGVVLVNAFDHEIEIESRSVPLGRAWRVGLATEIAGGGWTPHGPVVRFILAMDWLDYFGRVNGHPADFNIGGELRLFDLVAARAGLGDAYHNGDSFGIGVHTGRRLGRLGLQVDYANVAGSKRFHQFDAAIHWSL